VASAGTALKSKWSQRFPISRFVDWSPFQVLLRDAAYFQSRLASLLGPPNNTAEVPPAAHARHQLLPERHLNSERYASSSRRLVVFDRVEHKLLWKRDARYGFRHNNIALGSQSVFCIDGLSQAKRYALARRGAAFDYQPTLYALHAKTGQVTWSNQDRIRGTFLNYSTENDRLIQAGSKYRDRAVDESGRGIIAYRGADGAVIWSRPDLEYGGPCLLRRDTIITNGNGGFALDIHTGEQTGWKYSRAYGCNTAIGSRHLLTFRSGAAGFCDLLNDAGTGNLGGFRSSCTNNLIPADGVLSAPDYTRTCTCSYQNQASLALIHMPEAEYWTFGAKLTGGRLGINFGAPGDRRSREGTLWLDYPSVGGATEKIVKKLQVESDAEPLQTFRQHASAVRQGDLKWVASSGIRGVRRIVLPALRKKRYVVRLVFLEPDRVSVGDRVFDISVAGETVSGFDVVRAARGTARQVTREFSVVTSGKTIDVRLTPRGHRPTILSGIELILSPQSAVEK
ncbi:MAG: PQQ-binding-like beta-propeller repeat protein, partial [Planctomycetaceae bacterium]